jgi:tyrosinase
MKLLQSIVKTPGLMVLAMIVLETPTIAATLVRKNVVDLTTEEKADFVDAIKTLKTPFSSNNSGVSCYDEIVGIGVLQFM